MPVLLTAAYFPPIEYFAAMAAGFTLSTDRVNPSIVYIEACENYQKQSWRNRCRFYSASGPQYLTIPVKHEGGSYQLPIKEIRIDYSLPWVVQHQRAIVSAYRTSAYFEYYQDDLFSILDSRPPTLWELDMALMQFFIEKTGIPVELHETDDYVKPSGICSDAGSPWHMYPEAGIYGCDLRERIHPKRPCGILSGLGLEKPYFQVFSGKYGFIPNLSIMDLLFNEGPDSILYLKRLDCPGVSRFV